MKVDACPESAKEYERAALAGFARAWIIWRSRQSDGRPASWCATRRDKNAGVSRTVVRDTARQLAEALADQARLAAAAAEPAAVDAMATHGPAAFQPVSPAP